LNSCGAIPFDIQYERCVNDVNLKYSCVILFKKRGPTFASNYKQPAGYRQENSALTIKTKKLRNYEKFKFSRDYYSRFDIFKLLINE